MSDALAHLVQVGAEVITVVQQEVQRVEVAVSPVVAVHLILQGQFVATYKGQMQVMAT